MDALEENTILKAKLEAIEIERKRRETEQWSTLFTKMDVQDKMLTSIKSDQIQLQQTQEHLGRKTTKIERACDKFCTILSGPDENPAEGLIVKVRDLEKEVKAHVVLCVEERKEKKSKNSALRMAGISGGIALLIQVFVTWWKGSTGK